MSVGTSEKIVLSMRERIGNPAVTLGGRLKLNQRTALIALARQQAEAAEHTKLARKVAPGRDHIHGESGAEVSVIEYADVEYPFCKRFHATPASLLERLGGRADWVYRHHPLGSHDPAARRKAVASEWVVGAQAAEALDAAIRRMLGANP